jgi:hypothetical protein
LRIVGSITLLAALLFAACSKKTTFELHVGMTQTELTQRYGQPDTTAELTKHQDAIWGAIESYWSQKLDSGDVVTIWYYPSQIGTWELYFRNRDSLLDGFALAPEGAVY